MVVSAATLMVMAVGVAREERIVLGKGENARVRRGLRFGGLGPWVI